MDLIDLLVMMVSCVYVGSLIATQIQEYFRG
jgi:hypothetical protein